METAKPTIIVTGASGNLGRRLLPQLPEYTVVGVDITPPTYSPMGRFVPLDLGREESARELLLLMREVHGMVNYGTLDAWLGEIHSALKSGGILGIEDHRAKPDVDPLESSKRGYLPEKWVVERIEAAGFKLAGKSEVNANPKDTKDYSAGVWALPPSLQLGDQDRAKYLAIGESDRMTLKFVKVADKPADASGKK